MMMALGLGYVTFDLIIHVWFMYTVPIKTEAIILGKSAFVGSVAPFTLAQTFDKKQLLAKF